MAKIVVGANSSALNADILAVFEEEELDPIREMVKMVTRGCPVEKDGVQQLVQLDPKERFLVLKELAEYVAPKLKAVSTLENKKSKTIIKIVRHGERAILANGEHVQVVDGPADYTGTKDKYGNSIKDLVNDAVEMKPIVRAAAQIDAYGHKPLEIKIEKDN